MKKTIVSSFFPIRSRNDIEKLKRLRRAFILPEELDHNYKLSKAQRVENLLKKISFNPVKKIAFDGSDLSKHNHDGKLNDVSDYRAGAMTWKASKSSQIL